MTKLLKLLISTFLLIGFMACDDDENVNVTNTPTPNTINDSGCFLISTQTDSIISTFEYMDSLLVLTIVSDSSTLDDPTDDVFVEYFYDAENRLQLQRITTTIEGDTVGFIEREYMYDSSRLIMSTSFIIDSLDNRLLLTKQNYEYTEDRVTRISTLDSLFTDSLTESSFIELEWLDGNVITEREFTNIPIIGGTNLSSETFYTYSDSLNFTFGSDFAVEALSTPNLSKNLLIRSETNSINFIDTLVFTTDYEYEFNDKGLPSKETVLESSIFDIDSVTTIITTFEYECED
ncbi:hypothetical protein [Sediminitomix flava]|nr:hypothetical protein [Sediminitomix flava]